MSMYPMIMIDWNLCHSTFVLDDERYGAIEGVEYQTFTLGTSRSGVPSLG